MYTLYLLIQGTRIKLVVNMIMGTMMGALAEGLTLSKSADISPEILLQVIFTLVFYSKVYLYCLFILDVVLCVVVPAPDLFYF